jgi:hypothetical protein
MRKYLVFIPPVIWLMSGLLFIWEAAQSSATETVVLCLLLSLALSILAWKTARFAQDDYLLGKKIDTMVEELSKIDIDNAAEVKAYVARKNAEDAK